MLLVFIFITSSSIISAQNSWTWTALSPLPVPTANNALTEVLLNGEKYVYSFGGITDSLKAENIHQRVFKYEVSSDQWTEEVPISDTLGKIASGASFVNNKVYLIGGYHVENNGNEVSSNKVHVYNPFIDTFEIDAANVPIPIDDHVQAVWKDSLIYVISGWSNTGNVPNVQVFNPSFNSWKTGTSVPSTEKYKSFGASGYILEDTIYYYGGVRDNPSFSATNYLRKGVIDLNDPTQIDWELIPASSNNNLYRGACSGHNKTVFWVGGAEMAYNFDGLAYYTNDQVYPNARIFELNTETNSQVNRSPTEIGKMDLRGIAKLGGGNWIIAGGIDSSRTASDKTYLLHNPSLSNLDAAVQPPFFEVKETANDYVVLTENVGEIKIYDIQGRTLFKAPKNLANLHINKSFLDQGMLLFVYNDNSNLPIVIKKINP
jgi:hypothetical protein